MSTAHGHYVVPLAEAWRGERARQANTCGYCRRAPEFATGYRCVTGAKRRVADVERYVCVLHARRFAGNHGLDFAGPVACVVGHGRLLEPEVPAPPPPADEGVCPACGGQLQEIYRPCRGEGLADARRRDERRDLCLGCGRMFEPAAAGAGGRR